MCVCVYARVGACVCLSMYELGNELKLKKYNFSQYIHILIHILIIFILHIKLNSLGNIFLNILFDNCKL